MSLKDIPMRRILLMLAFCTLAIFTVGGQTQAQTQSPINYLVQARLAIPYNDYGYDAGTFTDREFGSSLALSADGNTALIGARKQTVVAGSVGTTRQGAAYVLVRNGTVWNLQTALYVPPQYYIFQEQFGSSVALSADGNTALIASKYAIYFFKRSGILWNFVSKHAIPDLTASTGHVSVALSGDAKIALVRSLDSIVNNQLNAYVYTETNGVWSQQAILNTPTSAGNSSGNNEYARVVALNYDGTTALFGVLNTNEAVYVFTRSGNTWSQQSILNAGTALIDFGTSVSISDDGNIAAVGAPHVASSGGTGQGRRVYIFRRNGTIWTQATILYDVGGPPMNEFGRAVDISGDGSRVAVSFSYLSGNPLYVYIRTSADWTTWTQAYGDGTFDPVFLNLGTGQSVALDYTGETALLSSPFSQTANELKGAVKVYKPFTSLPTITPTPTTTPSTPRGDTVGVYKDGTFYLRYSNTTGSADLTISFGGASDWPIAGDWDGDSVDTIGIYETTTGWFRLSNSNTTPASAYNVLFGNPGDRPIIGRWTLDMNHDGIGVYRNSNGILYQKKVLTSGFDDFFAVFGNPGDGGVAGDWNGDGKASIGIYRPSVYQWYLTNNNTPAGITWSDVNFQWFRGEEIAFAGDWNADGITTPGSLGANGVFSLHHTTDATGFDTVFAFGPTGGKPIAGRWLGTGQPVFTRINGVIVPRPSENEVNDGRAD